MKKKPVNKAVKDSEPRYAGTNWDEPIAHVSKRGVRSALGRKVLTRGIKTVRLFIPTGNAIVTCLRGGHEVRLDLLGYGEAIRLFPCLDKECKKMNVIAQTIGKFREALADKRVKIVNGDRELSDEETAEMVRENAERYEARKRENVSPDTVVTCPNCGTEFRVGKQLG